MPAFCCICFCTCGYWMHAGASGGHAREWMGYCVKLCLHCFKVRQGA